MLRFNSMSHFRAFLLCFLVVTCLVSSALASEKVEWTGWISDSKCGARMTGYCAKACITAGEKPVFVTEDKKVCQSPILKRQRTLKASMCL